MAQFTEEKLNKIWEKGIIDSRFDPNKVRKDACGAWIIRDKYDDRNNPFGWEVDHIYPQSKLKEAGVPENLINDMTNLRPLNWKNNVSKGCDYPCYQSAMKSESSKDSNGREVDRNIACSDEREVNDVVQQQISELFSGYRL